MKTESVDGKEYRLPDGLNDFQMQLYRTLYMI